MSHKPGSELHRRGLTNQTTHAKAKAEKDGEMGVCFFTFMTPQGSKKKEEYFKFREGRRKRKALKTFLTLGRV